MAATARLADAVDVASGPDAIPLAGARTLDFAGHEEVITVEGGALLVLDGLVLRGLAYPGAWKARLGNTSKPIALGINPSVMCQPGCLVSPRSKAAGSPAAAELQLPAGGRGQYWAATLMGGIGAW